jgi:hypothetical protein
MARRHLWKNDVYSCLLGSREDERVCGHSIEFWGEVNDRVVINGILPYILSFGCLLTCYCRISLDTAEPLSDLFEPWNVLTG